MKRVARRAVGSGSLLLAVTVMLGACTGGAGGPGGGVSPRPTLSGSGVLDPARVAEAERDVIAMADRQGSTPRGRVLVIDQHGVEVDFLWETVSAGLCLAGERFDGAGAEPLDTDFSCHGWLPPSGAGPVLRVELGPMSRSDWLTVLVAAHEAPTAFTCAGLRTAVRGVGELSAADGTALGVYVYETPWAPVGQVSLEVARPGTGTTALRLTLMDFPRNEVRAWARRCD